MARGGTRGYFAPARGGPSAALAAAVALLLHAASAPAQDNRVAQIATYQGADRAQRLIDGARREGTLTLYSVAPTEDNAALVGAFERKFGIKVNVYRASSEEIRQRVLNEYRARRYDVDLILNNAPAMEALSGEKALREVKSPHVADLIPSALPSHGQWLGFCLNVLVQAYNTNLVKKLDLPKSFADLADPKWKGKIAIEADDSDWFAALVGALGEERGIKLFREIAASNGFSVRKGHTLLTNLVSAGEVPLALTVFNYTAEQMKKKGAPIDRKSTRLNSSHLGISYAVFCLKKKKQQISDSPSERRVDAGSDDTVLKENIEPGTVDNDMHVTTHRHLTTVLKSELIQPNT